MLLKSDSINFTAARVSDNPGRIRLTGANIVDGGTGRTVPVATVATSKNLVPASSSPAGSGLNGIVGPPALRLLATETTD